MSDQGRQEPSVVAAPPEHDERLRERLINAEIELAALRASAPRWEPDVKRDEYRCALCGWTLAATAKEGCVRGNCSLRPLPDRFYDPARARAEYSPHLDNDARCRPASAPRSGEATN